MFLSFAEIILVGLVVVAVVAGVVIALAVGRRQGRSTSASAAAPPQTPIQGEPYVESCAVCGRAIGDGTPFRRCETCGVPLHEECAGEARLCPACASGETPVG